MTSVLACSMADRFAAVAPVGGIMMPEGCEPSRPVPVLTWHGTADPILLFNGGVNPDALPFGDDEEDEEVDIEVDGMDAEEGEPSTEPADLEGEGYPATVAEWAALNGCEDTFEDEEFSDEILWRRYDCPDEAPVEFVIVLGGGHTWPGSDFSAAIEDIVGHTTFDVDASVDMWAFFSRFRLEV
jgi:polyhydroxybutyrate depolymerase